MFDNVFNLNLLAIIMAEEVNTGGLMRFRHDKDSQDKLSDEERNDIREAYAKADERKRREKVQRVIIWMIIALIIVAGAGYLLLR
jgi:hypothetical protein